MWRWVKRVRRGKVGDWSAGEAGVCVVRAQTTNADKLASGNGLRDLTWFDWMRCR